MPFLPGSYGGAPSSPFGARGFSPWGAGGPQPMQPFVPQRMAAQAGAGMRMPGLGAGLRTPIAGASPAMAQPMQPRPMPWGQGPQQFPRFLPPQAAPMGAGYSPFGGGFPQMDPSLLARAVGGYGQGRIPMGRQGVGGLF